MVIELEFQDWQGESVHTLPMANLRRVSKESESHNARACT